MQDMIIFTKAPQSVIGPGAAINYPHGWSELVDYEAGVLHPSCLFIVVLGFLSPLDQSFLCLFVSCLRACSDHQNGHGIQKEDALDHIFGSVHWSFQWMLYLRWYVRLGQGPMCQIWVYSEWCVHFERTVNFDYICRWRSYKRDWVQVYHSQWCNCKRSAKVSPAGRAIVLSFAPSY
jgi:hypothetical protein